MLVLATDDTDADITAAIEAGAIGYLLKDTGREQLCAAIRAGACGESVLSPAVAAKLLGRLRGRDRDTLSSQEVEVLTVVARGRGNQQIAPHPAHQRGHRQDPPAAHLRQARRR